LICRFLEVKVSHDFIEWIDDTLLDFRKLDVELLIDEFASLEEPMEVSEVALLRFCLSANLKRSDLKGE
jgi:hypothetical protein